MRAGLALAFAALAALAGCSAFQPSTDARVRFDAVPELSTDDRYPNWPVHPELASDALDDDYLTATAVTGAGAGTTGAQKISFTRPELDEDFQAKGKRVPDHLDGINNSPRKELAAWALQRLFLEPEDYMVPATSIRCVSLERWAKFLEPRGPTVPGTNCVLIALSLWLQDVTLPDPLYDEERFLSDPVYAYHLANFNIFTYLINLRDNRTGNVLVSKDDERRHVFAIDNGVSFGTAWFNWFWPPTFEWRKIRVPALPRTTVDRLRDLERNDIDTLMVAAQLERGEDGHLRNVDDPDPPFDPDDGARVKGTTVQFGLDEDEAEDVWERIEDLLEEVDDGDIPLF